MMWADARSGCRRRTSASRRHSPTATKEQWEKYRNAHQTLKESLGTWPEPPKDMTVKVTRELDGDGS